MESSSATAAVCLFGDTEHTNPAIKREAASRLSALHAEGYTTLALELDAAKQPLIDALLSSPRSKEEITTYVRDVLKAKNVEGISALIAAAAAENMHILCIDDKSNNELLDMKFPEFRALRGTFNAIYHTLGDGIEQVTLHALRDTNPKQFLNYIEAYNQWKDIRAAADLPMAEAISTRVKAGEKVVAVVGQSHFARPEGIPTLLEREGIPIFHEDIYLNKSACASFLQRTFEWGEKKKAPPSVYIVDEKRRLDIVERHALNASPTTQLIAVAEHRTVSSPINMVINAGV
jgi:uncharacterized iron-regulated protein